MRTTLALAGLVLATVLAPGPGRADSFRAPPMPKGDPVSVQGYGRQNATCARWTDGCVLCTAETDGHAQCSTPGIACEPRGVTCKAKRSP